MKTRSMLFFRPAAILLGVLGVLIFSGCTTSRTTGIAAVPMVADAITWPADYRPETATFFVHNEIEIKAPPAVVWDILIQADAWPAWYVGAQNVSVKNSNTGRLEADSVFGWNTMGLRFESQIKEFVPPSRLSWESRKAVIKGYHAWLIIPTPEGCRVVTDESQNGFLASMQKVFIPNKLSRLHDVWLAELKAKAEARASDPR
jgi:uncharacterized protein YndB with AHSA1/START domain